MALTAEQSPNGPMVVAVVCDGVSSSARPDEASLAAVQAALPVLAAAVQAGGDLAAASLGSVMAARQAVADLQGSTGETSASTFVSVVASGYEVTLCRLGDSRAYWLAQPETESRLLTLDDSVRQRDGRGRPGERGRGNGLAARARADPLAGRRSR